MKPGSKLKKQSWSIVVMCYNEAASIKKVNQAVQTVLAKIAGPQREVLMVDDGSRDGTDKVLKEISKKFKNVRVITHKVNLGIGQALRSGYLNARFENVCVVPGDGQFDSRELIEFASFEKKTFVSYYREKQEGYNLFRLFISRVNNWINQDLLGIRLKDVNWVKVFKRDELRQLDLKLTSSLVASEICAKLILRGNQFIERPSIYHQRKSGVAKGGSFKTVFLALRDSLKLILVVLSYRIKYQLRGRGKN